MARIEDETLTRWSSSLQQVLVLAQESPPGLSGLAESAETPQEDLREVLESYEQDSLALTAALRQEERDDQTIRRLYSMGAAGDFDAAMVALLIDRGSGGQAAGGLEGVGMSVADSEVGTFAPYELELAEVATIEGSSDAAASWEHDLSANLDAVVGDSADRLTDFVSSAAVGAVGGNVLNGLSTVANGQFTTLIDAARTGLSWLRNKALALIEHGLSKIAALLGTEVRDRVETWMDDFKDHVPRRLMAKLAGAEGTMAHWRGQADGGVDVTRHLPAAGTSRESHLRHLTWAGRAAKVFGMAVAWLLASAAGVPAAVAISAGIIGWMVWAPWDHCRDVRRLVS